MRPARGPLRPVLPPCFDIPVFLLLCSCRYSTVFDLPISSIRIVYYVCTGSALGSDKMSLDRFSPRGGPKTGRPAAQRVRRESAPRSPRAKTPEAVSTQGNDAGRWSLAFPVTPPRLWVRTGRLGGDSGGPMVHRAIPGASKQTLGIRDAETRELPLPGSRYRTWWRVDLGLERSPDESRDAPHPRRRAPHTSAGPTMKWLFLGPEPQSRAVGRHHGRNAYQAIPS